MRLTLAYLPTSQTCNASQLLPVLEQMGVAAEALRLQYGTPSGSPPSPESGAAPVRTLFVNPEGGLYLAHYFSAVYSRGDLVAIVAGGLDPTPELLAGMLEQVDKGADAVIASRYHKASRVTYPWRRLLVSKAYNRLVSLLFSLGTTDSRSGLKLYRREMLIQALQKSPPQRVAFDVELLATIRRLGGTVAEIPVTAVYAQSPYAITLRDIRHGLGDTLRLLYHLRLRKDSSRSR